MPRRASTIGDLRRVIDCLPVRTREAMLDGIGSHEIIVGAYSDRDGGVCPMLAAHRCGGRTSFVSFARSWDAFTGVKRARRATERELRILETNLIGSLAAERRNPAAPAADLGAAIAAHASLRDEREAVGPGVDFADAISAHQAATRARHGREAEQTGGWGFLAGRRARQDGERALDRAERERARAERELV